MIFKTIAATAIVLAWSVSGVFAQELTEQQRQNYMMAVMVEWTVANCDASKVTAIYFGMAQMTLNGGNIAGLDAVRDEFRGGVETNYSGVEAACADLLPRLSAQ